MKKNMGMKILASLALFAILASVLAVGIMALLAPAQPQKVQTQKNTNLNTDYAKIKVGDIKAVTSDNKKIEVKTKEVEETKEVKKEVK